VVGGSLAPQKYAYAMAKDSPIRDRVNYGILTTLSDTAFVAALTAKYIGDPDGRRFSSTDNQLASDSDYTYAYALVGIIGGVVLGSAGMRAWEEWRLTKVLREHADGLSALGAKRSRVSKEQALGTHARARVAAGPCSPAAPLAVAALGRLEARGAVLLSVCEPRLLTEQTCALACAFGISCVGCVRASCARPH
jgi:hypothetical protein